MDMKLEIQAILEVAKMLGHEWVEGVEAKDVRANSLRRLHAALGRLDRQARERTELPTEAGRFMLGADGNEMYFSEPTGLDFETSVWQLRLIPKETMPILVLKETKFHAEITLSRQTSSWVVERFEIGRMNGNCTQGFPGYEVYDARDLVGLVEAGIVSKLLFLPLTYRDKEILASIPAKADRVSQLRQAYVEGLNGTKWLERA